MTNNKGTFIFFCIIGILCGLAWYGIIFLINKYSPSPLWGLIVIPIVASYPLIFIKELKDNRHD